MKKSQLRSDPEKTREWQDRSRTPLNPGVRKKRQHISRATRSKVRLRSSGWCIVCLEREGFPAGVVTVAQRAAVRVKAAKKLIRGVDHLHHVLAVQTFPQYEVTRANLVGVCAECHDEHERAHRRIPFEALPLPVVLFAQNAGGPEALYLDRTYPCRA